MTEQQRMLPKAEFLEELLSVLNHLKENPQRLEKYWSPFFSKLKISSNATREEFQDRISGDSPMETELFDTLCQYQTAIPIAKVVGIGVELIVFYLEEVWESNGGTSGSMKVSESHSHITQYGCDYNIFV
jgi:hypothetical protein